MLRFLHFSDVHLPTARLGWRIRDSFGKRVLGYTNIKLFGRGHRFRYAGHVVDALVKEFQQPNDALIFSGDATQLAFESEFTHSATRLNVAALPHGFAVPGNHDYYTRRCARAGFFEKHFGPWQHGDRIDGHTYPFARRVGPAWLIGVNSSNPGRFLTWNASGTIGRDQLERLKRLCSTLAPGPRILVTHYPLRNANGMVERRSHRLLDHREALAAALECKVSLWLHGHIHSPFVLPAGAEIPFPVICAGSCTQVKRFAHNAYELDGSKLRMQRRVYHIDSNAFTDAERYEFDL